MEGVTLLWHLPEVGVVDIIRVFDAAYQANNVGLTQSH